MQHSEFETGDAMLGLLGLDSKDARVQLSLDKLAHGMRPELPSKDEDELVDWVTVNEKGLEYGFEDRAYVQALDVSKRGSDDVLLSQLYFYGDTSKTKPFPYRLPFKLDFSDDRRLTRLKLGEFEATRHSYFRDSWHLPTFDLTAAYADSGQLESLYCHIPYTPWPVLDGEQARVREYTPGEFAALFGRRWSDPELRDALAPLGYEKVLRDVRSEHSADLRFDHGVDLMFAPSDTLAVISEKSSQSLAFAGVTYYASRVLDARQWIGPLPYELDFSDDQSSIRAKVGREPDEVRDEDRSGVASWHIGDTALKVLYSNIENRVLKIILDARKS